jgi:hypothetical protein
MCKHELDHQRLPAEKSLIKKGKIEVSTARAALYYHYYL